MLLLVHADQNIGKLLSPAQQWLPSFIDESDQLRERWRGPELSSSIFPKKFNMSSVISIQNMIQLVQPHISIHHFKIESKREGQPIHYSTLMFLPIKTLSELLVILDF